MPTVSSFPVTRSQIAGIPVSQLAEEFGTPAYIYDAAKIVERIGDLKAFDVVRYAQKACSNIAILDLIRQNNVLVDAVSAGEIRRAIAAGYALHVNAATGDPAEAPHPIVYTSDIFDR